MAEPEHLVVTTPWYPSEDGPYHGIFVRESVRALGHPPERTTIVHVRNVPPQEPNTVRRSRTPEGELLRIDVPLDPHTPRAEAARAHRRALTMFAMAALAEAEVVHAHVGMPTGWAVSGLLRPEQRLVGTEHATYLPVLLRTPETRRMYRELVQRCEIHLAVTEAEARRLRAALPQQRDSIATIGNPVDDERFAAAPHTATVLERWLYIGNLIERKNVTTLLDAFAAWQASHPSDLSRLTLVGAGLLEEQLRGRAQELGIADRVVFHGTAAPDDLPALLADADVLVHLADHETFGLTMVEAAMTGLPVVASASVGPQETLSDAQAQGLAEILPTRPAPGRVAETVDRLATRAPTADAAAVRAVLVGRYGTATYRRRLGNALAGRPLDPAPAVDAPTVLCLGSSQRAAYRLVRLQIEAHRAGARVALATTVHGDAMLADPRTAVLDLARGVGWLPWRAVERTVLQHMPAGLLRVVRKGSSLAARVPGPHRRVARRGVGLMSRLLSRQTTLADRVSAQLDRRVFVHLESAPFAAAALRRHGDWFDAQNPQIILMGDDSGLPLAWRLARRFPDAQVLGAVSDAALREAIRAARERDG